MTHQNLHGQRGDNVVVWSGWVLGTMVEVLGGTFTMDRDMPPSVVLDPGGAARDLLLPPEEEGLTFIVTNNADAAEDITVKEDSGVTTIGTISQNEIALLHCAGGVWRIAIGKTT